MTPAAQPPRHAERVLRRALQASPYCDDILGDLHETFVRIRQRHSAAHARWWYRLQAVRLAVRYAPRLRTGSRCSCGWRSDR